MPGKVALGISSVCLTSVLAARQKTGVEHLSSLSITDTIGSLFETSDTGNHAFSLIQQEMTPGLEQDVDASLKAAITKIEEQVETKIKRGQEQARQRFGEAYGKYERLANEHQQAKRLADDRDKEWYQCVEEEQAKQKAIEAARRALADARGQERQACQAMMDIDDFRFQAEPSFKFECDVAAESNCQQQYSEFEKKVEQMERKASAALQDSTRKYNEAKADCEAKKQQTGAAEAAINKAQLDYSAVSRRCQGSVQSRQDLLCRAGKALQAKCAAESQYQELLEQETKADAESEADRIREWRTTASMKCLLAKYADGGMGDVVDRSELEACSGDKLGFERLDLKQQQFNEFSAAHPCKSGPVTFFNGKTWKVYKGRYTNVQFTPDFIPGGDNPFAFCAGGGAPIGEQNLGGGGGGPLAPPEPQFADGSVLHELAGTEECEVTWATVPTKKAGAIDPKLQMGATLATWGCDRLKKAGQYGQLVVMGKAYAVVSC